MPDYIHSDEFLADFASGEERAYRALHREFFAKLTTAADGIIKNYTEAEDIAMEALYRLMTGHKKFAGQVLNLERLKNHLYLSVRNRCFNYLKSFRRTTSAADKDFSETLSDADVGSVEEEMVFAEGIARLREILEGLSEEKRTALQLVYYENKKVKDAAAEMALPLTTFKRIRARAIEEISRKMPGQKLPTTLFLLLFYLSSILSVLSWWS